MTRRNDSQTMPTARLDRTLEYAVVQSWDELLPGSIAGLIRIEYQTGADGSLDFLKVWASTIRGHWTLVSECWMKPLWSHTTGLRFSGDHHSAGFARTLNLVMTNESSFSRLPDQHGSIQVYPPTEEERSAAKRWMDVAFSADRPRPAHPHIAA